MRRWTWRADVLLVLFLALISVPTAVCQYPANSSTPFSSLLESGDATQLSRSIVLSNAGALVAGSPILNGRSDVWLFLPSDNRVVRLGEGSSLQLSNLGIISNSTAAARDLTAVLTLPFFDVAPTATLLLRNVSMNIDCGTLSALQDEVCSRMPNFNFEVWPWSLRVVSLTAPNLSAVNVTLRCNYSATNGTATVSFMGSNQVPLYTEGMQTISSPLSFPCVASRVSTYPDFVNALAPLQNLQPLAFYVLIVANLTGADYFVRAKVLTFKYRVSVVVTGRPDVPTQFDLRSLSSVILLPDTSTISYVEFRDLTLVNLDYGPREQYPLAFVTAALWFLDYRRTGYAVSDSSASAEVNLTRVTLVVSSVELRWWRGQVEAALSAGAADIDPAFLIQYYAPGLQVVPSDGSIRVPFWKWTVGLTAWTDCVLTSTPLVPVAPVALAIRPDFLDTLQVYGQTGPVPMSAVRLARPDLGASFWNYPITSVAVLSVDAQLPSTLAASPTILGANLTVWGDGRGVRYINLQALAGAVTVPPYTVLTLRFSNLLNLGVGPRTSDPSPLQNYALMMWSFNRTLLPASGAGRRMALQSAAGASRGGGSRSGAWLGAGPPHSRIAHLRRPWERLERRRLQAPVVSSARDGPAVGSRRRSATQHDAIVGGGQASRRRHLLQVGNSTSGSDGGSGSGSSSSSSKQLSLGPFRPWLRLENVNLYMPSQEVKLVYDIWRLNKTSLRVSPDVVDWLQGVLATAEVRNATSGRVDFKWISWLGVEGIDVTFDGGWPTTSFSQIQPTGSIIMPAVPPPPPPTPPPPPPTPLRPSSSPPPRPTPPPSNSSPTPQLNTTVFSGPPPLAPSSATMPVGAAARAPATATPIGSIVGPAVGSAAGLLILFGLVAFLIAFLRKRHRAKRAQAQLEADAAKDGSFKGECADDVSNGVRDSSARCRNPKNAGSGGPPPPPSQAGAVATTGAAGTLGRAAAERPGGAGCGAEQGEIQPVAEEDVQVGNGAPAAAAAAAGAGGSGKPPLGQPPPRRSRSREAAGGSGRRQGSSGARRSGTADDAGADGSGCGTSGPSSSSAGRKSRSSASTASAGSGSKKSSTGSSGFTSDVCSNPRTELYAALAAFQSELGDHQQQITIINQLGAGAHGVVYKGEWRGLEVAVKTLLFQAFVGGNGEDSGNSVKEQAMLEAAIATTLFHPNVINTFSYDIKPLRMCPARASATSRAETVVSSEGGGIMDWKLYIIQEYCDGGTLKDALDTSRLNGPGSGPVYLETAVRIAIEIASGMSYIHARNIIHGDLKPANILLRTNSASPYGYTAKIADFGLALKLKAGESHISNIRRGTPFYIASELVEDGRATTASDLYSFGVILWELLHGCTVARRLPLRRRIPNLPAEFYTWPPDCPPPYRELASACLSSIPAKRPRFAEALSALIQVLNSLVEARKEEERRRRKLDEEWRGQAEARRAAKARLRPTGQQGQDAEVGDEDGGSGCEASAAQPPDATAAESGVAGAAANGGGDGGSCGSAAGNSASRFDRSASPWPSSSSSLGVRGMAPPPLPDGALRKLEEGATRGWSRGHAAAGSVGGAVGDTSGCSGVFCGARRTGSGGGAPSGTSETASYSSSEAVVAPHGPTGATATAAVLGSAVAVPRVAVGLSLEPTPEEDEELQPQKMGRGGGDEGRAKAAAHMGFNLQQGYTARSASLALGGAGAPGGGAAARPAQAQSFAPFGGARPTTLRALVCTASAAAAEGAAAAGSTGVHGDSGHGGSGGGGVDERSSCESVACAGGPPPSAPPPPTPAPAGVVRGADTAAAAAGPAGAGAGAGAAATGVGAVTAAAGGGAAAVCNLESAAEGCGGLRRGALISAPSDSAYAQAAAAVCSSNGAAGATRVAATCGNPNRLPADLTPQAAALTNHNASTLSPGGGTALPAAAAAVVLAAALHPFSVSHTPSTLDHTTGILDSCLGSSTVDARAMDRGLMLDMDLMPALSNQEEAPSSQVSSALNPELAAALENMLGAHGIRRDAAPGPGGSASG